MKIAFFSPKPFCKQLGATKNRIELAETLETLGWSTFLISRDKVFSECGEKGITYNEALKHYLIKNASQFDIVLYEYNSLPFNRALFYRYTLFIARPALLFFSDTPVNNPVDFKTRFSLEYHRLIKFLKFWSFSDQRRQDQEKMVSLSQSDLIQVQNSKDAELLVQKGFEREKIIVVPNGISDDRRMKFNDAQRLHTSMTIAFVGTFDFRKGALDFPHIIKSILKTFPDTRFKFLGTKGLFMEKIQVLSFFPKKVHKALEIIPAFPPEQLPDLLRDCRIGIFPSYLESFGFGVLEMMCSGIPVVSYDIPGPSDFVPQELLVPKGDKDRMVEKVLDLMSNQSKLVSLSEKVRLITNKYNWTTIAQDASQSYLEHHRKLFTENPSVVD